MLKWENKQKVSSLEGWSVTSRGRFSLEYRDQSSSMMIEIRDEGFRDGVPIIFIGSGQFFSAANEDKSLPEPKLLMRRLQDAMMFQGLSVEYEE